MKHLWLLFALFLSLPAHSAGMTALPENEGFCSQIPDDSAICHEWRLNSYSDVYFIAFGYEDGIEYTFRRRLPSGKYDTIVMIHPVLRDESYAGKLFWGYPWDITDVALPNGGGTKELLVSFDAGIVDDGEVYPPAWQKQIPAVMFIGNTTQPEMTVPALTFKPTTLRSARFKARGGNQPSSARLTR